MSEAGICCDKRARFDARSYSAVAGEVGDRFGAFFVFAEEQSEHEWGVPATSVAAAAEQLARWLWRVATPSLA